MQHLCQRLGLVKDSDPVSLSKTQIWDLCQRLRCGIFAKESNIVSLPKETHIWCLCQRIRFRWLGILAKESTFFARWASTLTSISACVRRPQHSSHTEWRRLQVHEQQSERQKKNPFQKCLIFSNRAKEKLLGDRILWVWRLLCHVDSNFELH